MRVEITSHARTRILERLSERWMKERSEAEEDKGIYGWAAKRVARALKDIDHRDSWPIGEKRRLKLGKETWCVARSEQGVIVITVFDKSVRRFGSLSRMEKKRLLRARRKKRRRRK